MKKQKQPELHPSQTRYLQRRIALYFLLVAILEADGNTASSASDKNKSTSPKNLRSSAIKKSKSAEVQEAVPVDSVPTKTRSPVQEQPLESPSELLKKALAKGGDKNALDRQLYADVLGSDGPQTPSQRDGEKDHDDVSLLGRIKSHLAVRKGVRRSILAVGIILFSVIGVQLFYPSNRALPLSRMQANGYLGFADERQILKTFEDFDSRTVTVHTHTKTLTTSYKDLGVTIAPDKTIESMTTYSLRERLIPFSILLKGNKTYQISRDLNESQLNLYVRDVINQTNKQPADAVVTKQGTQLVITPSEEGYAYQGEVLRSHLLRSDLADKGQIVFAPTILPPKITSETAEAVVKRMQQRIDAPLFITAEVTSFKVDSAMMASWVDITPKPEEKTVDINFNRDRVAASLAQLRSQVDYPAVDTIVTYLNGVPAGRQEGAVGKSLKYDELVDRILATTSPSITNLEAVVTTLPPPEKIERKYTKDSTGIQTMLSYWTANHNGEHSIDFQTVNGRIVANSNPHQIRPSAGVYRMFIGSLIYGKIASGTISSSTVLSNGQSVGTCLERMLAESESGCTNVLGDMVGWGASDSLLKSQGFENTTLTAGAGLTSASDLTRWFVKVYSGNIVTKPHSSALLQSLNRETNRSGIPAGSPGMFVASKAGSAGRTRHEAAIVYHPGGMYVLSVMSEGSSAANFADLAREINKILDQ